MEEKMQYPFGETVRTLIQEDRHPKKVFVLGVYASAVHATWVNNGRIVCRALAVASEPRIFWDGDEGEATEIINKIHIPSSLGTLRPASSHLNGPSARALDNYILTPLGYSRNDTWLCDCLPQTRLNRNQLEAIRRCYDRYILDYGLNPVTIGECPKVFCDERRAHEITDELFESSADLLILLGNPPISQYLARVSDIHYKNLADYTNRFGYGTVTRASIRGKNFRVLPLAHPRQIAGLGCHCGEWKMRHSRWIGHLQKTELPPVINHS